MNKKDYILENDWWKLEIQHNGNNNYIYKLISKGKNITYTDQDYHYHLFISSKKELPLVWIDLIGGESGAEKLISRKIQNVGENLIVIEGNFSNSEIILKQEFKLEKESRWLEEKITLTNQGTKKVRLVAINLGFKKEFFKQHEGWVNHLDEFQLTAIPTRRFHEQTIDRRLLSFSANDLIYAPWFNRKETELPGFCSEGWLWGNSKGGILICKYNPTQLEFSRFSRFPKLMDGRGNENISLIFGGAFFCQGNPELATELNPDQSYTFGISKYTIYEGDYRNGYYLYRDHLKERGHEFSKNYDPPINWNELYNLGWPAEKFGFFIDSFKYNLYTLEDLYREAEIAQDIGAECLYLDPGWNTFMGSEIWNEERYGPHREFYKTIHEKYSLKLGLHLMVNFASDSEPEEFYLKNQNGERVLQNPYLGLYAVCANEKWAYEKTRRLLDLAEAGVDFFLFDFMGFSSPLLNNIGCCSPDHGHEIPMRRQTHAQNILKVIKNIKKKFPNLLIEAHDRGVDNALYFQHGLPDSFDENWGFEYMWNPMQDLISLKSLSLYEYNLAYSIPLYLHINEHSDNDNMLQFWWYASVVRHLGIGGLRDKTSKKYNALKKAIILYKKIKSIMVRGIFYGIDPMIHLHVDEDTGSGIITAYNLTSRKKKLRIKIDYLKYSLKFHNLELFNGTNQKVDTLSQIHKPNKSLELEIEIPPLSPIIAILR